MAYNSSYTGAQIDTAIGTINGLTGASTRYVGFNSNNKPISVAPDTSPVSGSSKLITSGAVYTAILGAIGGSY